MIEDPTSVYLAIGAIAATLLVVSLFDRWAMIVVILMLAIVGNQLEFDLNLRFSDQSVSPADLAFAIAAVAAGLRMIGAGRLDPMRILWLAITVVLLVAFVRGSASYGFELAATSYRYWFYMSTGTLYVFSFPWPAVQADRLARLWLVAGAVLATAIVLLWIDPDFSPLVDDLAAQRFKYAYETHRVVGASTALVLAEAGMIGLANWLGERRLPMVRLVSFACLIISVLLYHRSVWVATAVGIMTLMVLHRASVHRLGRPLFFALVLLAASVLLAEGLGRDLIGNELDSAVTEALDDDSTLNWRLQGWQILVSRAFDGGPTVWLFGAGFGVGYERTFGFTITQVSPHNLYVELFLNAGLLGLGLWLYFFARVLLLLRRMIDADEPGFLDRRMAIALLVMTMTYCIPYALSVEQSIFLGALAALAIRAVPGRAGDIADEPDGHQRDLPRKRA